MIATVHPPLDVRAAPVAGRLLALGAIAGPVYVLVGLAQVIGRPGFDLRRHSLSLLANGDLGWVQTANFAVSGALTIAGAIGLRRSLGATPAGTWGPRLLAVYGAGLLGASVLRADPALGFPAGTPADEASVTWHGIGHLVSGGIGFLALIACCLVFARRFAKAGRRGWMIWSIATGLLFLAAFAGIASGGGRPALNIAFSLVVLLAWTWISALTWWARSTGGHPH